jgi:hypothetical protein
MACITTIAPPMTMATTQFTRETARKAFAPVEFDYSSTPQSPRMNWVVVTDSNGSRRLRMNWMADGS